LTVGCCRQARKTQDALSSSARTKGRKQSTGPSIDYLAYLASFSDFSAIPAKQKTQSAPYQQYLTDLKEYLLDFYRRTQPLVDLDDVIDETSAKFEKQWALHDVAGWDSSKEAEDADNSTTPAHFCELCNKQFSSEGVFNGHLSGKKHMKAAAKAANGHESSGSAPQAAGSAKSAKKALEDKQKVIAFDEVLIRRMYELLTEVVQGTISYLELKQTRTHEELQAEIEEEEEGTFSDVDVENENEEGEDEEEQLYNPLNLPLGWDGKPIPYWLYKLHGLGVEFKCEICGNHSYWGRRAFDRHFQEWRHAFGMRCLKIPNTKHFHDITLMRDAIQRTLCIRGELFRLF
jgi:splicing factor 3A subunit 3